MKYIVNSVILNDSINVTINVKSQSLTETFTRADNAQIVNLMNMTNLQSAYRSDQKEVINLFKRVKGDEINPKGNFVVYVKSIEYFLLEKKYNVTYTVDDSLEFIASHFITSTRLIRDIEVKEI